MDDYKTTYEITIVDKTHTPIKIQTRNYFSSNHMRNSWETFCREFNITFVSCIEVLEENAPNKT